MPGAEVPATVPIVDQGNRKSFQIHIASSEDVLFAGSGLHNHGFNAVLGSPHILFHDAGWVGVGLQTEGNSQPGVVLIGICAGAHGRSQNPEPFGVAFDLLKEGCRRFQVVGAANDGSHFQVPVHFGIDPLELPFGIESVNVFPHVVNDRGIIWLWIDLLQLVKCGLHECS